MNCLLLPFLCSKINIFNKKNYTKFENLKKLQIFQYFSGGAIWHPRCGPSPDAKIDDDYLDEHKTNGVMDNHVCVELNIFAHLF